MPPLTRVVPDSNVYIAAALTSGYCHDWLFGASRQGATYELYTSEKILEEVSGKLIGKFGFSQADAVDYLSRLDIVVRKVRPRMKVDVVRDPDDAMILECAVEAKAELVITFDKDLLSLKTHKDIRIAHPGMVKYWF